jgi:hypothetical protein
MTTTKVNLANTVEGILPVANGGTGTSTGVAPGGSTTQVQYNNAGAFGGDSGFVYTGGNVGIGTNSPERRLHLRAPTTCDMTIQCGNTTDYSYLYFGDSASATQGWVGYYNTEDSMRFGTNNAERMRIDSSGNVAIGRTASISYKLDVDAGAGSAARLLSNNAQLLVGFNSTSFNYYDADTQIFRNNAGTERFRIGTAGQLGIGGANYGSSGQVLTSNGSGSAPSWALPTEYKIVEASTTTNRTLVGDSGWVTHLTVNFTTTQVCTVMCFANFAHGYEQGAVQIGARFTLDGTTSTTQLQVVKQGFTSNAAFGAHSSTGFLTNVSVGSHTVTLECRNFSSGTTGILNYFDNPGPSTAIGDTIFILYK